MKYALKFWPEINLVEIHHSEGTLPGIETLHQGANDKEIENAMARLLSVTVEYTVLWLDNMKPALSGIKGISTQDYLIRIEKSESARWSEIIAPIILILAKISDEKIEKIRANRYGKFGDPSNYMAGGSAPVQSPVLEKSLEQDAALNAGIYREIIKKYPTAH